MSQKTLNILYGVVIVLLIGTAAYFALSKNTRPVAENVESSNNSATAINTNANSGQANTVSPEPTVYETQYLKITVQSGWTAKEASQQVYDNSNKPTSKPNPAAVNITKGNYILYINTKASQASGAEGGRFAEISSGAPSADAVIKEQPSPECGTAQTSSAFLDYLRKDLYVSAKDKQNYPVAFCNVPSNGATVWYFSYLTTSKGGYFNYYKDGQGTGLVVTMAYNSKDINKLPVKGSADLKTALDDMTAILKTLQIKQQ